VSPLELERVERLERLERLERGELVIWEVHKPPDGALLQTRCGLDLWTSYSGARNSWLAERNLTITFRRPILNPVTRGKDHEIVHL
jgi:hypothetical protein